MSPRTRTAYTSKYNTEELKKTLQLCQTNLKTIKAKRNQKSAPSTPNQKQRPTLSEKKTAFYRPNYTRPFEAEKPSFPDHIQNLILGLRAISEYESKRKCGIVINPHYGNAQIGQAETRFGQR